MSQAVAPEEKKPVAGARGRRRRVPIIIAVGTALVIALGFLLVRRATAHVNRVALASLPSAVTAVEARKALYAPTRQYVGTFLPWVEAKVGPQLISAYVGSVLVRPGDQVHRGQVIGTLDCRNASASSQAVSMQARALAAQQEALAHEAGRIAQLQHGGFASENEIEKKQAESASKQAELLATKASLERATLQVNDCVLRAPFDGEVADRTMDPGAYVHPGETIVSVIDRTTVRVGADVPESDFDLVRPGVEVAIHGLATDQHLSGRVARRSPAADLSTRTVHFEVDLPDPHRTLPVGTTAELAVAAGKPMPALRIPLMGAAVKGDKATLFLAGDERAHRAVVGVLGEQGGNLFLEPSLPEGSLVITQGRALLKEGDHLTVKVEGQLAEAFPRPKGGRL